MQNRQSDTLSFAVVAMFSKPVNYPIGCLSVSVQENKHYGGGEALNLRGIFAAKLICVVDCIILFKILTDLHLTHPYKIPPLCSSLKRSKNREKPIVWER